MYRYQRQVLLFEMVLRIKALNKGWGLGFRESPLAIMGLTPGYPERLKKILF